MKNDPDLIRVNWLGSRDRVIERLRHMYNNGWQIRRHGLSSVDEQGRTVLAKPVHIEGGDHGIAVWKISNHDEEVI